MKNRRRIHGISLLLSIICLLLVLPSFAQNIKISGKVLESLNGTPVVGASVVVQETGKGVNTDVEGRFFIVLQKGKAYSLKITSLGYAPKVISDISATNGSNIDVSMERDNGKQLENIVVKSSSARKESAASIYLAQKNSSSISDGISSEVIKRSPDKNTGEVLKRVSGASVQDNKFVVIRGLNERYNESMLNNVILPSTEPDKKAFSFDIIPASLVDNLVIYKSSTPDLPGDFAGGAIKISTRDYPAQKLGELSVSVGYNSQSTFKDFYKGSPDGNLDFLGILDKSRTIPNKYYKNRANFSNLTDESKLVATKAFSNTFGNEKVNQTLPNLSVSYTGGNTKLLNNSKKLGYIYSINYGTARRISDRLRSDYLAGNDKQYDYQTNTYDIRNNLSALLNLTYSYGRSKISWKNLFNNDFTNSTAIRTGADLSNDGVPPILQKSTNTEVMSNGLFNSVLEGLHSAGKGWTVDWNTSFSNTYRWQPDQKILTFKSYNSGASYKMQLNNENSPAIRTAGRVYSFLKENMYSGGVNVTKQFNWLGFGQKLKLGGTAYYRDRNVEVHGLGYSTLNSANPGGIEILESKTSTFNNLFSNENIDTYKITIANISDNSTDYDGTALLSAGYAMLDNRFSDKIKLTWGARVESYDQQLKAKNKGTTKLNNIDVLPSAILTYEVTKKANIRLAASQSVNRPEFRELAFYNVYDYENNWSVRGTPDLKRSRNTNADLRYEWFPAAGEIISASAFYKHFQNPIEQINEGNDVFTFKNAKSGYVYGAEVELRKKLDFMGSAFADHLTFYANAAYIKGKVQLVDQTRNSPIQGQSPYLINGGITYATTSEDFLVNVLYNRIGPRVRYRGDKGGFDILETSRNVLDLQVSKKFKNNRFEVKLTVSDILANAFMMYYKFDSNYKKISYDPSTDAIVSSVKYGSTTTLALKYNF